MGDRTNLRYQAIEEYLRERISALQPGDALPTDRELCDRFGVSRMTARQAVTRLVDEGLVRREPGRGTFIAHPRLQRDVGVLLSFTRQMERHGRRATSRLLECGVVLASAEAAVQLGLAPAAPLLRVRRLRLAGGEPTALELVLLPYERFAWLENMDWEHRSLHAALEERGVVPYTGDGHLQAAAASREEAHLLGLAAGAPLLVERLALYDQNGLPIEAGETRYAGDRYVLDFRLHRGAQA